MKIISGLLFTNAWSLSSNKRESNNWKLFCDKASLLSLKTSKKKKRKKKICLFMQQLKNK